MVNEEATSFPEWFVPMAATLTQERFSGPEWIFERKYDGIRLLTFRNGRTVRLLSRNRLPQHHPAIEAAVRALPVRNVILDGEVGWHGDTGYHVFDVLWLDGEDLRARPLEARRALLARLPLADPLLRVPELDGPRPWERACAEGWEGVVAKRRDAAPRRALGPPEDRGAGIVHRMDRSRKTAAPSPRRRPARQGAARGGTRDAVPSGLAERGPAREVVITHPEKVMFPDEGITKG